MSSRSPRPAASSRRTLVSNTFELEWPPKSGRRQAFPEIDRAEWFDVATARTKMIAGQDALLDRLLEQVL
jgi:predicted NUDIX family NTP pyrophosphohydrolase